jgi:hypothetical protein
MAESAYFHLNDLEADKVLSGNSDIDLYNCAAETRIMAAMHDKVRSRVDLARKKGQIVNE